MTKALKPNMVCLQAVAQTEAEVALERFDTCAILRPGFETSLHDTTVYVG
jgi:hypothetical protein